MGRRPDFLVIGAARSGTTFLHRHLRTHPEIWLPPKKEIYYFSYQSGRGFLNRRQREHVRPFLASLGRAAGSRHADWRDIAWSVRYLSRPPSDAWFLSLLPDLPDTTVGQIEPSYANLPERTIRHIASLMPDVRIILMMRDPIDRAWSQVLKRLARQKHRQIGAVHDTEILRELDRFGVPMSSYADILDRWQRAFPGREIVCTFYDTLLDDPRRLVDAVCRALDVSRHPRLDDGALARRINDTQAYYEAIPADIERWLAERLLEPTQRLTARHPGPAEDWIRRMRASLDCSGNAGEGHRRVP